jgi:hypothetical protein
MNPTAGKTYGKVRGGALRRIASFAPAAVLSHWAFQSLFYMDATERWFKLAIDLVLGVAATYVFSLWLPLGAALALGFLVAHTINFLCNGHLWGVLKHYGLVHTSAEDFDAYVRAFQERARRESSLRRVIVFGSVSRQEWSPSSDLDARVVRRPGLVNALRACWFVLCERSRALARPFPLDIYILDSAKALDKQCQDEALIDLL